MIPTRPVLKELLRKIGILVDHGQATLDRVRFEGWRVTLLDLSRLEAVRDQLSVFFVISEKVHSRGVDFLVRCKDTVLP